MITLIAKRKQQQQAAASKVPTKVESVAKKGSALVSKALSSSNTVLASSTEFLDKAATLGKSIAALGTRMLFWSTILSIGLRLVRGGLSLLQSSDPPASTGLPA